MQNVHTNKYFVEQINSTLKQYEASKCFSVEECRHFFWEKVPQDKWTFWFLSSNEILAGKELKVIHTLIKNWEERGQW